MPTAKKTRETWRSDSTLQRWTEIQRTIGDLTTLTMAGNLHRKDVVDRLAELANRLASHTTRLRHHLGRCTRGHVIGPIDTCVACGATLERAS